MKAAAAGIPATAWIGTSNIVVPGTKKTFPDAFQSSSRLTYYASLFNSLEINSSFYKVPMPATFEKWCAEVPASFRFTVKMWRDITHAKALAFKKDDIHFFMEAANRVRNENKGCLLIQFPASITIQFIDQVAAILEEVLQKDPQHTWQTAVEFRHNSWYNDRVYQLLNRYRASPVLHDMPASALSDLPANASFVNLRFHGIKGDYRGSYESAHLQQYAIKIRSWLQEGRQVYAYFNNTIGNAFENAQELKRLLL